MDKAIIIGFELLMFSVLLAATVNVFQWSPLAALFPAGCMVVVGMIIVDIART